MFGITAAQTYAVAYSLPTTIEILGYTAANAQLLTIPVYAFACILCIVNALIADRLKRRFQSVVIPYFFGLAGVIICLKISPEDNPGIIYFAMFLIASGSFPALPTIVSWIANNVAGQWKRSVAMALEFTLGNMVGGITGSNVFISDEAPMFRTAYLIMAAYFTIGIVAAVAQWVLLILSNRQRDRLLQGMSMEDRERLDEERKDDGDKSPFFRYTL
jgi:MFS family permease